MKKAWILAIIFSITTPLFGIELFNRATGTTGGQILKLPSSSNEISEPVSLTTSSGAEAVVVNPALIGGEKGKTVSFLYANWIADVGFGYVGMISGNGSQGYGVGIKYLDYGAGLYERSKTDNEYDSGTPFTAKDLALTLAYSRKLNYKMALGLNATYVRQSFSLSNASAVNGFALGVGILYTLMPELKIGASVQRLGFLTQGNTMLPELALGADYVLFKGKNLRLGAEIRLPLDYSPYFKMGLDYGIGKYLNIKAGFNSLYTGGQGVIYGLGFGMSIKISRIIAGFAYSPQFFFEETMGGLILFDLNIKI